jgi:hypothetical protein
MRVRSYERGFFLDRVWRYEAGEHVSLIGRTNAGKTHLAHQLLAKTATPALPVLDLVMKPKDRTTKRFAKQQNYRIVKDWPLNPVGEFWRPEKPSGYVLWPPHSFDPAVDDVEHNEIFRRGILDSYKRGKRIIFADEVYSLARELDPGLARELVAVWTKGRSMEAGLWGATQRPRDVPYHMYSAAEHLFLAYDPDDKAIERYGQIGGVDPKVVRAVTSQLPKWHWLYIRRGDRTMCVVTA